MDGDGSANRDDPTTTPSVAVPVPALGFRKSTLSIVKFQ